MKRVPTCMLRSRSRAVAAALAIKGSSGSSLPSLHTSHRFVSGTGSQGPHGSGTQGHSNSAVNNEGAGFMAKLKSLYHEFQVYQDRRLDAAAAEEAQEGRDRFFAASTRVDPRQSTSSANASGSSGRRGDSPLISRNPTLCPRSVLFVPGSKPRAMEKLLTLNADCYILDLEDSVGVGVKRQARENIRDFVEGLQTTRRARRDAQAVEEINATAQQQQAGGRAADGPAAEASSVDGSAHYPRLIVRINSPDFDPATAMLDLELVGMLGPAIEGIAIPKITPRSFSIIKDYIHPDHQLWAFFESPSSVIQAPAICRQQVYQYAVMGYNDLSTELQLPMVAPSLESVGGAAVSEAVRESLHIAAHLPLWQSTVQVLQAARAHGMFVLDAVFNDPTDRAGFRRSLQECRALGLNGKTLIHPSQIEPTNAAYTPAESEVTWAMRIVEAVQRAQGNVATVDGKMVEELHQRQANRVLALRRSAEAERQLSESQKADEKPAEEGGAGEATSHGSASERTREPRRTPSRHRPLN